MPAEECSAVAQAISIQGKVELLYVGESNWRAARQGDLFCPGDRLRVGANSRAGLNLNDESLLRLAENSSLLFSAPAEDGASWVDLLEGIVHFISRVRQPFRVDTPFVNASVEGTEFTVEAQPGVGRVTVLEGRVRARNEQGEVILNGGQRGESRQGRAPIVETVAEPRDAVQWALYYPPVMEPAEDHPSAHVRLSLDACREGDLEGAFAALAQEPSVVEDSALLVYRASLHLRVGGTEAARRDLAAAMRKKPEHAEALALMSIIATVRNERQEADKLAERAVRADPELAAAHLALSYARQARFQLTQALDSARQAVKVEADNALAWSRLAQLHLMFRHMEAASEAAEWAVDISPDQPQTRTTLGFAQLIGLDLDAARDSFRQAQALDQASPLPRLGLGLVLIRQGALAEGRRQLEIAANLDPGNALIRSYLGKAYYEERRSKRAETQFALAKQFDELDPTAWFYDAILKQTENRPLEALSDLRTAVALNDNRAIYRSRLLLDEDQAARSASLARIYNDLGFERLALKESWKSLAANPGNPSAHRFLSDSYAGMPRHEIARISELLRARMLTAEIVSPISPSASEASLLAFQGSGPSLAGYNEYNPLFNRRRLAFLASGISGSNNTRGKEIVVGGFNNRGMLSGGNYTESSDGFRENNDSKQTIRNLFGQLRLTSKLSLQGEVRHREGEYGDMQLRFDPSDFSATKRRAIKSDSTRLGINYSPNVRNTLLLSANAHKLDDRTSMSRLQTSLNNDGWQYELQYIYHGNGVNLVTGLERLDLETKTAVTLDSEMLPAVSEDTLEQRMAHLYLTLPRSWGQAILGVDYVDLDDHNLFSEHRYNPKFGLLWNLSERTLIRLAAFRTLRAEILDNQTLMPTEIAGFNQIYDDYLRTDARRYALGIDHSFGYGLDGGIEISQRNLISIPNAFTMKVENQREWSHKAFLYWRLNDYFKFGSEYTFEKFERDFVDGQTSQDRPSQINAQALFLNGSVFHPSGFIADFVTSRVSQKIESVLDSSGTSSASDSFWVTDAMLGYRLPKRYGLLKMQVKNLFDKSFHFQSTFPGAGTEQPSPYYPERTIYLNAQFWF